MRTSVFGHARTLSIRFRTAVLRSSCSSQCRRAVWMASGRSMPRSDATASRRRSKSAPSVALQRRVAAYLVVVGPDARPTQRCLNPGFSERIGNSRRTPRAWSRTPPATGPARSGTHATCGAPRRHTMPSAQAAGKRGGGAGRTSVSQSSGLTGHSVRRAFAEGVQTWAQSAFFLGKWRARQDSNLRPPA